MKNTLTAQEVLSRLPAGAEGELYEVRRQVRPALFRSGTLESLRSTETAGRALRVIVDGRLGFSTTTDLGDAGILIRNALDSAQGGEAAGFHFPPPNGGSEVPCFDPEVEALSDEEMIAIGKEVIARIQAVFPQVQVHVGIRKEIEEVSLWNTSGLEISTRRTLLQLQAAAQVVGEQDIFFVTDEAVSRRRQEISPQAIAENILRLLRWSEKTVSLTSGAMPVVFHGTATAVLLLPLLYGLNGRDVYQRTSPLSELLDRPAFDPHFTLVDDGRLPFAYLASPTDDEGIPTDRKVLVQEGVIRQFLYDLKTAALAGTRSTGNGYKGQGPFGGDFRRRPDVAPASWLVMPGEKRLEEILEELDQALLVEEVLGLGQGNVIAGEFSNNVELGFLVRRGEVVGRVKNTMIAGNAYELLRGHLLAFGDRPRWVMGWLYVPAIALDRVSVVCG